MTHTAKILDNIAIVTESLSVRAGWIKADIAQLKSRPDYTTHADDALKAIQIKMLDVLTEITKARVQLKEKGIADARV